ncbi:hypothetical protein ACQPXH_24055 [Nocardia sp. CA-135953]|uniref:hypothetical protein n=1 Tax=Nocardia sp. CA-135953 TaxID=3239978 RepID=UPI003D96CBB9
MRHQGSPDRPVIDIEFVGQLRHGPLLLVEGYYQEGIVFGQSLVPCFYIMLGQKPQDAGLAQSKPASKIGG